MRPVTLTLAVTATLFCILFSLEKMVPLRRRKRALFDAGCQVVGLVTQPDRAGGNVRGSTA